MKRELRHGDEVLVLPKGTRATVEACWFLTAQVSVQTEEGTRCFIVQKHDLLLVEQFEFPFEEVA